MIARTFLFIGLLAASYVATHVALALSLGATP